MENEVRQVFGFTASYRDWEGSVEEWQSAFFTLLSHKNTFGGFYELTICSGYNTVAYVYMVCDSYKLNQEKVHELLTDLGYKPESFTSKARVFEPVWEEEYDNDEKKGISFYFVE